MRLVDTSAWIEWLINSPTGVRVGASIPTAEEWLVPTIVQFELAKWLSREIGQDEADRVIAFTQTCRIAPLDTRIALSAAEYSRNHKLATADAIVYDTAVDYGVELLTCDAHFEGLPDVIFVPKAGARA